MKEPEALTGAERAILADMGAELRASSERRLTWEEHLAAAEAIRKRYSERLRSLTTAPSGERLDSAPKSVTVADGR